MKQRVDAIEQYQAAGRQELADKESAEKAVLEAYLPAAPDAAKIEQVVAEIIAGTNGARFDLDTSGAVNILDRAATVASNGWTCSP